MSPIDSQLPMPTGPSQGGGGGSIALNTLIDYIIQRTYAEMSVLSELLPRKSDMERKIEIVQFSQRTRQLFVRLLALVKWANSASKVDKCGEICNFLEQQSLLFVETADAMAKMARETLVNARLPNFPLPYAVDVLTTGTYPRLPTCIRDKIVPADPITVTEKRLTLQRLSQVIQYRLVCSELPPQMRRLKIENGRVKFLVEYEFEVTLTLMGDSHNIPWRLLDIDILVEDHQTGDGKSLVHSLQVNYIHRLVQSRLLDNEKPLHDLYRMLHSFCLSLQLEVLHSQIQRLVRERLGDSVRVEDYTPGKCLVISYWRDQIKKDKESSVYKLSVHVSKEDEGKPLQISHSPLMTLEEARKVGISIRSEHLSIEKLIIQTIEVRTHAKLKEFAKDLQKYVDGPCEIKDVPAILHVPILNPHTSAEVLRVAIDIQRGTFLTSVPCSNHPVIQEIEENLNNERRHLDKQIAKLRSELALLRCEKSVQQLPASSHRQLPFINFAGHPLESLSKHKLYVRVPKQTSYAVVVEVEDAPPKSFVYKYYLLEMATASAENIDNTLVEDNGAVKPFLKANHLTPINIFSLTHGPYATVFSENDEYELDSISRKRKLLLGDKDGPSPKMRKESPYFVAPLAFLLAHCEEKLPFVALTEELTKRNIPHQGIQVDGEGSCMTLTVMDLPNCKGCTQEAMDELRKNLLCNKFRIQVRPTRNWIVEFVFTNCPIKTTSPKEQGPIQRVYFSFDLNTDQASKTIQDLLDEWALVANLYQAVYNFSHFYNDSRTGLQKLIEVRSYNYRKLTIVYGVTMTSLVNIFWRSDTKSFHITLGTCGQNSTTINPHVLVITQLEEELNSSKSADAVANLVQLLNDTWSPLTSINKLSTSPLLGGSTHPKQSMLSFTIIPQSTTHVRIAFRNVSCVDVHFRSGKMVAVRDGAISLFDTNKVIDGFSPTPGLKAFLNMFVDETVTGNHPRRRSTTEDDHPMSPIVMDSFDSFLPQNPSVGSPASRPRQDGNLRFQNPMTPPSNPHTPASPSTSRISSGYASSPAAAFSLSSPPSLPPQVAQSPSAALISTPSPSTLLGQGGSPGNPQLHVPSPGSFVPTPSPQSLGIHLSSPAGPFIAPQGMVDGGSPFTMPSPGTRNWPGSPSVQGPSPVSRHGTATSPGHPALHSPQTQVKDSEHSKSSVVSPAPRMLQQRSWAASIPTILSHDAFSKLLTPCPLPGMNFLPASPLERFLGCVYFRRHLPRVIQGESSLQSIQLNEPGVSAFKVDSLQFRVSLNPTTLQSLHIKVTPTLDYQDQWANEEIQILEKFFDLKVASPPYKVNALTAFCRLLGAPARILRDCLQIMRLELMPDRNLKWSVQWCLTIPPGAHPISAPAGTPAIVVKSKMIIMLLLTRIGLMLPSNTEPQSVIVPLIYDIAANTIQLVEARLPAAQAHTPAQMAIVAMLRRFAELHQNPTECAIFPSVRELMTNLVIPIQQ
ncbi:mediator of RNA polymerase II transcription subunit 14-like [Argonauta hians]